MKRILLTIFIVAASINFAPVARAQTQPEQSNSSNDITNANAPAGGVRVILPEEESLPQSTSPDVQANSTVLYVLAAAFLLIVGIVAGISVYSNAHSKKHDENN